ncbi:Alpha-ketoglutaric semialdehyde dehydrogenase 1, partial [Bienertia sinuspersici]
IVKGCIWSFEQEQALGFTSVSTNIHMTVIKLKSGGLWIHAPIAPAQKCIQIHTWLDRYKVSSLSDMGGPKAMELALESTS